MTPQAREFIAAVPNRALQKPFDLRCLGALVADGVARRQAV